MRYALGVTRNAATNGYSWSVTFLTNVGDQEAISVDTTFLLQDAATAGDALTVYDGDNKLLTRTHRSP